MLDEKPQLPSWLRIGLAKYGNVVRAAREASGLTVEELGRAAQLAPLTVRVFETGEHKPTEPEAWRLATVLGIPAGLFQQ